jgi:hypothetical protein
LSLKQRENAAAQRDLEQFRQRSQARIKHTSEPISSSLSASPDNDPPNDDNNNSSTMFPAMSSGTNNNKVVSGSSGIPRSSLVLNSDDQESVNQGLRKHEWLVSQCYIDPDTQQLYEVVNVHYHYHTCRLCTLAQPKFDTFHSTGRDQVLTILGDPSATVMAYNLGARHLVALFQAGRKDSTSAPWPTNEDQWLLLQQQDSFWNQMLQSLDNSDVKKVGDSNDCYFRPILYTGLLGALRRRKSITSVHNHNQHQTSHTYDQIQMIIPSSLISTTLYIFHEGMGHPGRHRTIQTIKSRYFWLSITEDVSYHIHCCHYCQTRKADNHRTKIPIMTYNTASVPWERCHLDLTGPLPTTRETGYKYILLFKDALTKFIILQPLTDKTGEIVLNTLLTKVFHVFGPPQLLITDRGTEFSTLAMKYFNNIHHTRHVRTTPANPRSDGLAENAMRTLKDMLAGLTNIYHNDWDTHLTYISYAYNNTINVATGYTPAYLLFGRDLDRTEGLHDIPTFPKTLSKYAEDMVMVMQNIWLTVGETVARSVQTMNRIPRTHLQFQPYSVGEYFYHRYVPKSFLKTKKEQKHFKLSIKLQNRWSGPFRIMRVISPVIYEADIHGTLKKVHAINMKR